MAAFPGSHLSSVQLPGVASICDSPGSHYECTGLTARLWASRGGWHLHETGEKLNVHMDYSLHPKLHLQRKLNLIVYLTPDWDPAWGGQLGLWSHDPDNNRPLGLIHSIDCLFNRAVLFDTTQNSWHGLPDPITCPAGVMRRSIALYYLIAPTAQTEKRYKALFAPTEQQKDDPAILELIRRRSGIDTAKDVYF